MKLQESIRKNGPPISTIRNIDIPHHEMIKLDNGIPVYYINEGSQELTKIDVVFRGGRHHESKKSLARTFGSLMKEGTAKNPGENISAYFDYHGASFNCGSSLDHTTFTLFSLSRFFPTLLRQFTEIIFEPLFPETELEKFKKNSIQKLKLDLSKNEIMAYRHLTSDIFGESHTYGYNSTKESFTNINRNDLLRFHKNMLEKQPCYIFLTGKYDIKIIEDINELLGKWNYSGNSTILYHSTIRKPLIKYYSSLSNLQSAIRLGRHFGSKRDSDYGKLSFLSNVLGGYFGSRLMKNIREDKGFTYNIYSDLDTMLKDGYFYITTELDKKHVDPTIEQIFKEMKDLRTNPISQDELDMNRNYIMGNLLSSLDGPFQAMRLIKSAILSDQSLDDVQEIINTFANINTEELLNTANKYLNPDEFFQVIVG